jgi:hypothetical protein
MRFLYLALFAPLFAWAQAAVDVPTDLNGVAAFIPALLQAIKSGNWLLFGAFVSLILTYALRTYVLPKMGVGSGALPWISLVIGAVAGIGGAVAGGATLGAAAMAALSGPLASTLWDMVFQYFLPKPVPAPVVVP